VIERDKQVDDQQKKHANEKEREQHPQTGGRRQPEPQQAGMATDPEVAKDKGYAERIEEKTEKH
jgi:hypothetical protein